MVGEVSAKPSHDREWFLARIALALGRALFDVEEADAIMAWVQAERPPQTGRVRCAACDGSGRRPPESFIQGVCLACHGKGFQT